MVDWCSTKAKGKEQLVRDSWFLYGAFNCCFFVGLNQAHRDISLGESY